VIEFRSKEKERKYVMWKEHWRKEDLPLLVRKRVEERA